MYINHVQIINLKDRVETTDVTNKHLYDRSPHVGTHGLKVMTRRDTYVYRSAFASLRRVKLIYLSYHLLLFNSAFL